jgi:alpha,alpha-trehalase
VDSCGFAELDASLLLLVLHGFEDARSPRMKETIHRIRDGLGAGRGLVYRYRDGESPGEGAFLVCSFWLAECLAKAGEVEEARAIFEGAASFANDLGLFAEEADPATGELLGNFPQAYTHVGLVNAALAIEGARSEHRGEEAA